MFFLKFCSSADLRGRARLRFPPVLLLEVQCCPTGPSEPWVNLLFYLFGVEALQEDACDCLFEIVSKRMEDPARKLALLQRLNICSVLPAVLTRLVADLERDGQGPGHMDTVRTTACAAICRARRDAR